MTSDYVQYGAGLCGPAAWLNFDISPSLRLQRLPVIGPIFKRLGPSFPQTIRFGDIVSGLPLPFESCKAMYCSHTLEHLALDDFRKALRNTYQHLRPGGRFRFVVPDLEALARAYLANPSQDAALVFMQDAHLGKATRPRGVAAVLRYAFGNSAHLWMWDFKALSSELYEAGFEAIRRAEYGDSGDSMFDVVEDRGRWENCLGMDCRRPK